MGLKENLFAGSVAEKKYLKTKKELHVGYSSEDLEKIEQQFIDDLAKVGFASITDYHSSVFSYGHYWRTLTPCKYNTADHIPDAVQEALDTGQDILAGTLYKHTTVLVPDVSKASELVHLDYCQSKNIEVLSDLGTGGAYISENGNIGIMIILHRPSLAVGMEMTLKIAMQNVLLYRYDVETYIETNELMTKQFIAHPNGVKIWGDTHADLGKVSMVCGALTLEFNTTEAKKILKKRPDHPEIKEPHGLNDLIGYKIAPAECLEFLIAEWLKETNSNVRDIKT